MPRDVIAAVSGSFKGNNVNIYWSEWKSVKILLRPISRCLWFKTEILILPPQNTFTFFLFGCFSLFYFNSNTHINQVVNILDYFPAPTGSLLSTIRCSLNVAKNLRINTTNHYRRVNTSSTPHRKPEISSVRNSYGIYLLK
jgi:hypothetical protein